MRILNLYAGIGGNRTHWQDCDVTAVELNPTIASFYAERFPTDEVVVGDAGEYLLGNYQDFDFVWSSYPCQKNSRARFWAHGKSDPVMPGLGLYEEVLFLRHYFEGDWVVENVIPYYEPLIPPTAKIGRHLFWSSRSLAGICPHDLDIHKGTRSEYETELGISLGSHRFNTRTDQILRNCVHPEVGRQVMDRLRGINETQEPLFP